MQDTIEHVRTFLERERPRQEAFLAELVKAPSDNPAGDCAPHAERAAELLEMMGMGDRIHHNPNELSGGQKQRVAIARSLANDPDLLLADEPTGALDSKTGRMVMDLFHKLHKDLGKSVVFITHNPELAEETERVVEMMDGRVANVRTPAGLGM